MGITHIEDTNPQPHPAYQIRHGLQDSYDAGVTEMVVGQVKNRNAWAFLQVLYVLHCLQVVVGDLQSLQHFQTSCWTRAAE